MDAIDWSQATGIAPGELPAAVTAYLIAHQTKDVDTAIAHFAPGAAVTDEGRTHRGPEEIRAWLSRAASEYTYTTQITATAKIDDRHYDVVHHLEGDFPGVVVDLHFRFTLADALITRLVIEP
jgi:hypothetical protein